VTAVESSTASPAESPARRVRPLRHRFDADGVRGWPLARVFAVGAVVAGVILLAVVATGGYALWRLVEVRTVAAQVGTPAFITGQRLSVALVNEESGVRGFGATGRPEFLEPYLTGLADERAAIGQLRALAPRGPRDFGPELDAVEAAVRAWRADYAQPVLDRAPGPPPADLGKARFDAVRAATATLLTELDGQRQYTAAAANAAVSFLIGVAVAIAVVLAAFVVATGIGLRQAVLKPVSRLAAQVRDVVSGSVHSDVRATGPREIVELGADVDAMRRHILRDLEEAQRANERLDAQARDLERSNRDLEQFAYVASHDLQEPLRKVSSFCQLLQRRYGGQLDERADQYIGFAVDGAQRMQRLINDLLAFSRVGRTTDGFEPVDLGEVAASAVAQLDTMREEAGGTVEIGALPEVSGDPVLLRQLMINLIGNGLKFRRPDVPPLVRVQATREGSDWQLEVVDNGIGIEPDYTDKVFVIFQRLHARDSYAGTGIGLALAKKIVEFHGGQIAVVSAAGPGTTIRFTLPAPTEEA
jgi:signal transduction histidine kinase